MEYMQKYVIVYRPHESGRSFDFSTTSLIFWARKSATSTTASDGYRKNCSFPRSQSSVRSSGFLTSNT